jgi:TonB family protein
MSYKKNKVEQALAETQYSKIQQKNRRKALAYSVAILVAILMILFLIKLPPMDPPLTVLQEMQDNGGGGEIILGQDLVGANSNDFASAGSPAPINEPVQEETPTPTPDPQPEQVEEAKPTEEPVIEKKEVKKEVIKTPVKPLETKTEDKKVVEKKAEVPVVEKPKEPVRQVDKRSLFSKAGAGGPGGNATSQGTGTTSGVQGSPNGKGTSFTGGGTTAGTGTGQGFGDGPGKGGFSISGGLKGRKLVRPPVVKCQTEQQGKVNIALSVDKDGNITEARSTRGTTISDPALIECAEQAARKMKFEANPDAPEIQTGVVSISFKLTE